MPAFPFHGWMPDAYRAMPLPALAVFSGVVSKVAAYGFLRIALPLFPAAAHDFQTILLMLALLSILYGSVMAFTQTNVRLILGYSSMAQLGFITLGIFAARPGRPAPRARCCRRSTTGSWWRRCSSSSRCSPSAPAGSEDIRDMGGIAFRAPVLAALFLIATLATLAMPGSANFVGEFLILLGSSTPKMVFAFIASIGVVLASVYALRLYIRVDAQPPGPAVTSFEMSAARRARARAAGAVHRGLRAVPAAGAGALRAVGQAAVAPLLQAQGGGRRSGRRGAP